MPPTSVATSRGEVFQPNSAQAEAIAHVDGPMLVLAGAGTGKTSVLVHRIIRLVRDGHASPDAVIAATFTNKAAGEIRDRVATQLGKREARQLRTFTFHAYCYELLKRYGLDFGLLTKEDLWVFLRKRLDQLPLKYFVKAADPATFLDDLLTFFDRCNDELVDATKYAEYVAQVRRGNLPLPRVYRSKDADEIAPEEIISKCEEISGIYSAVESMLQSQGLMTFGSLITEAVKKFRTDPSLAAQERAKCSFLLIDEFQDSNHAQIELARLLSHGRHNVFAVGDPDQAIYHFRGASSGAFQRFLECFPGSKVVNLAENQRSTPAILSCAYTAIHRNPEIASSDPRLMEKLSRTPLQSMRALRATQRGTPLPSAPVRVVPYVSYSQEAAEVAQTILETRKRTRESWSNFAVLYRSHRSAALMIEELGARGIPFVVVGVDLLNTAPLRDLLALLHCLHAIDDNVSLFRLAIAPRFKIPLADLQHRLATAKRGTPLLVLLKEMDAGRTLLAGITELHRSTNAERAEVLEIVEQAIRFLGLDASTIEIRRFRDLVEEWRQKKFVDKGDLAEFLEYLELWRAAGGSLEADAAVSNPLLADADAATPNAVQLLTIHTAKGLEFAHVAVLRVVTGSFPLSFREKLFEFPRELREGLAGVQLDDKTLQEHEERRLFYVAVTRARDTLSLYGKQRGRQAVPSGFLRELADARGMEHTLSVVPAKPVQLEMAAVEATNAWLGVSQPGGSRKLSASAIEQYDRCPLQFKLSRIWNLPSEVPAAVQYGAAMHTTLKDYYDAFMLGRDRTEAEVIEIFRRQFEAFNFEDEMQRELYLQQGTRQLQEFVAARAQDQRPQVLGTEVPFEIKVGGTPVVGRLDRMDAISGDAVAIVDYKTGNPKSQDDADRSLQLSIYALAVQRQFHKRAQELILYNLENNAAVCSTRSDRMLALVEEKVQEAARGIAQEQFSAKPGFHCRWCGYKDLCPATEERLYHVATNGKTPGVK